jgi:hypothetical protein
MNRPKKGDAAVNFQQRAILRWAEDHPKSYGHGDVFHFTNDAGEAVEIPSLQFYRLGWAEAVPCWDCGGFAPFSNYCDICQEKRDTDNAQRCEEAIQSPKFTHARARKSCGQWDVHIYHRDRTSPSGVRLAASGPESLVEGLLRQYGKPSPLSPTEGL